MKRLLLLSALLEISFASFAQTQDTIRWPLQIPFNVKETPMILPDSLGGSTYEGTIFCDYMYTAAGKVVRITPSYISIRFRGHPKNESVSFHPRYTKTGKGLLRVRIDDKKLLSSAPVVKDPERYFKWAEVEGLKHIELTPVKVFDPKVHRQLKPYNRYGATLTF